MKAARLADPGRHPAEQLIDERAQVRLDIAVEEVASTQTYTTIYIVPHPARRTDAPLIRVGRTDAADAEAVAPVNVRHGQAGVLNARQERHVGHLVGRLVGLELFEHLLAGKDQAIDAHARFIALGNPPAAGIDLLQRAAI